MSRRPLTRTMFLLATSLLSVAPLLAARLAHGQTASTTAAPAVHTSRNRWQAVLHYDSLQVPFMFAWSGPATQPVLALYNGVDSIISTRVVRTGDSVVVHFDHLAALLRGVITGGSPGDSRGRAFAGWWVTPRRGDSVRVTAEPQSSAPVPADANATQRTAPDVHGTWLLPVSSAKGEKAWRLVVTQQGAEVTATVLRVDGDAGAHVGRWQDSVFRLSHFDGTRPGVLELRPHSDGALHVTQRSPRGPARVYVAWREAERVARGLEAPADVRTFTGVRDSTARFTFDFPDLEGRRVSDRDARFAGKVVVVNVTGTWCPNCHDEAPFLTALYAEYGARGLEVVALDFEDAEELQDLARVRAFVRRYGVTYPYLIAGTPREVAARIPLAVNLNTWPATFFLGRDGRVRAVRTGFAAKSSGPHHDAMVADYRAIVERLLAEGR